MKKALLLSLSFFLLSLASPAIHAQCNAAFTWEQIPGTLQIHFNSSQSTSEHDIVSYAWTFGDTHTSDGANPYHTYETAGTYLVCLTITDNFGCVDDVCHEVTVLPVTSGCNAQFNWEQLTNTLQLHFHSTSTSEHDITSYSWNFGDGHTGDGSAPYHTYEAPGTYLVCLTITDNSGCTDDICHEVTVAALPSECHANFIWEQFQGSYQVDFTSTSTSDHGIVSYHWIFGDGNTGDGQNTTHTYLEPGTYVVCLVITNEAGCVSDECHEVTVTAPGSGCNAQFNWEQIPGTLQLHFHSTSTSEHDITSYSWNFGDGHEGDGSAPYHTYDSAGVYLVCLTITDNSGCTSTECHEVTVEPTGSGCNANFNWEQIPGTQQIHFHSTSTSEHDITSYSWNFGDGHEGDGANPYHTYETSGTYVVCLTITDNTGCTSTECHEVTVQGVESDCHADFTWEQIPNTYQIHFHSTSTSSHDIISYGWHFGDGHEGDGANPYHTYETPGTYVVCLRIEDNTGCVSEICHEVTIQGVEGCHAQFNWEQLTNSLQIHFHSTSTSEHDITSYSWNFGDGHEGDGSAPYHTYDSAGVYLVCLTITDNSGCTSTICHEVTVQGAEGCHANFTWEQIPGTQQIHFHSTSTSAHDIVSYHWTFGDGSEGDGFDPYHGYEVPGTYVVCLTITDNTGCTSTECHEVTIQGVESGCHASFNWEQIPNTFQIHFHSTSTSDHDITSYSWNFGDGHTGDGSAPYHTYDAPGSYEVCLTITDNNECTSTICHLVTINGPEECQASFSFESNEEGVVFFNNNSTGTTPHTDWFWEFGDGETSDQENPQHDYGEPGIYTVCLTITDTTTECSDQFCLTVVYQLGWEEINYNAMNEFQSPAANTASSLVEDFSIIRYTNPASEDVLVEFALDEASTVKFELYDLNGNKVYAEYTGLLSKGIQQQVLRVNHLQPGLYILSVSNGLSRKTMQITVSK